MSSTESTNSTNSCLFCANCRCRAPIETVGNNQHADVNQQAQTPRSPIRINEPSSQSQLQPQNIPQQAPSPDDEEFSKMEQLGSSAMGFHKYSLLARIFIRELINEYGNKKENIERIDECVMKGKKEEELKMKLAEMRKQNEEIQQMNSIIEHSIREKKELKTDRWDEIDKICTSDEERTEVRRKYAELKRLRSLDPREQPLKRHADDSVRADIPLKKMCLSPGTNGDSSVAATILQTSNRSMSHNLTTQPSYKTASNTRSHIVRNKASSAVEPECITLDDDNTHENLSTLALSATNDISLRTNGDKSVDSTNQQTLNESMNSSLTTQPSSEAVHNTINQTVLNGASSTTAESGVITLNDDTQAKLPASTKLNVLRIVRTNGVHRVVPLNRQTLSEIISTLDRLSSETVPNTGNQTIQKGASSTTAESECITLNDDDDDTQARLPTPVKRDISLRTNGGNSVDSTNQQIPNGSMILTKPPSSETVTNMKNPTVQNRASSSTAEVECITLDDDDEDDEDDEEEEEEEDDDDTPAEPSTFAPSATSDISLRTNGENSVDSTNQQTLNENMNSSLIAQSSSETASDTVQKGVSFASAESEVMSNNLTTQLSSEIVLNTRNQMVQTRASSVTAESECITLDDENTHDKLSTLAPSSTTSDVSFRTNGDDSVDSTNHQTSDDSMNSSLTTHPSSPNTINQTVQNGASSATVESEVKLLDDDNTHDKLSILAPSATTSDILLRTNGDHSVGSTNQETSNESLNSSLTTQSSSEIVPNTINQTIQNAASSTSAESKSITLSSETGPNPTNQTAQNEVSSATAQSEAITMNLDTQAGPSTPAPIVKRGRGRPRKVISPTTQPSPQIKPVNKNKTVQNRASSSTLNNGNTQARPLAPVPQPKATTAISNSGELVLQLPMVPLEVTPMAMDRRNWNFSPFSPILLPSPLNKIPARNTFLQMTMADLKDLPTTHMIFGAIRRNEKHVFRTGGPTTTIRLVCLLDGPLVPTTNLKWHVAQCVAMPPTGRNFVLKFDENQFRGIPVNSIRVSLIVQEVYPKSRGMAEPPVGLSNLLSFTLPLVSTPLSESNLRATSTNSLNSSNNEEIKKMLSRK